MPKEKMSKQPKSGRREPPNLSREAIIALAVELIDAHGLENFGIRSVAKSLGVFPTAIYWHVPSRHALIAGVIAVVLADLVPPMDLPWQKWVRTLFVHYRELIRRHPNTAPLIGAQLVSSANINPELIERTLTKLTEAGFPNEQLVGAYNAVIGGMVGFVTQEFAMVSADGDLQATIQESVAGLDSQVYPLLADHASSLLNKAYALRWDNGILSPLDSGFEIYTDAFIQGLAASVADR